MACKYLHIVNGYTVTAGSTAANLTLSKNVTSLRDEDRFCIKVCTSIPETYDTYTAQVIINGSGVPLWNKYGNPLTISELRRGVIYQGYYGETNEHIIVNAPKIIGCGCA